MKTLEHIQSYKKKIGIIHDNYASSDSAFLGISYANKLVELTDIEPYLFYKNLPNPVIPPACSMMNVFDVWGFDGLTIALDLDSADALIKCVGPTRKVLYAWDLEWLRPNKKDFLQNVRIYRGIEKLVCRSDEHRNALSKYCNRDDIEVIEDFNLFEFCKRYTNFGVK